MQLLARQLKHYWKWCIALLILASVNQVFSLLDPLIFRHVIDSYAMKIGEFTLNAFIQGVSFLLLLSMGAAFVSRVAKNLQDYVLNLITHKLGAQMYELGVSHALQLPFATFEDKRSGETLGVLSKARQDTEKFLASAINILFVSLVGFVFVIIYAATVYWGVALVYFLTVPIVGGMSYLLSKKIKVMQQAIVGESTALAGSTTESLRNIELVKALGLESEEVSRLNSTTEKILNLELKKLRYIRSLSFVQGTLINLIRTAIMLFLLYLVFIETVTFGQFFTLYIYSFFVFGPLQELGTMINISREAQASLHAYQNILEAPVEKTSDTPVTLEKVNTLTFDEVHFAYNEHQIALSGVTFSVNKGETIAIVGPSGSGKSSLVKLLVGLYRPTKGAIKYNNTSHADINLSDLRKQIGFVTQETQLFSGTILENLTFVNKFATDDEITSALEQSASLSIIQRAPNGMNTTIGESGMKLSGGERQRLSIARALLRKPTILVFDEATSSLDSLTEEEITKTMRELSDTKEHITILIAHRLSTIMHADRILVLERGKIIETGTHHDLVAQKGLYYAMWRQQIGE